VTNKVKEHWDPVVEVIQSAAVGDIYAVLEDRVQDVPMEKQVVLGDDNLPVETGRYDKRPVQSQFWLVLKSGDEQAEAYMGTVKRPLNGRDEFKRYSFRVLNQLLHQTGIRLEELAGLKRDIYFTGDIFGFKDEKVDRILLGSLLQSDDKTIDLVRD
jgi:hypothetical protein